MRKQNAAKEVAAFNRANQIGTHVRYWKGVRHGDPTGETVTETRAQDMYGNAVVWLRGVSGCIALSHVEVV